MPELDLGMPPAVFLRDYWQQRPVLLSRALPGFRSPLTADDLAAIALAGWCPARLIRGRPQGPFKVQSTPFDEGDFTGLPPRHWTLLVQDLEQVVDEARALQHRFAFIPHWRMDDVMASVAARGGSVGAHVDQYDVFLVQAAGRRHWQWNSQRPLTLAQRNDSPLRLLKAFDPDCAATLEPGDVLYLPPGIPHHGVAETDDCQTWSVGFRAPSVADLCAGLALAFDQLGDLQPRLTDAQRTPATEPYSLERSDVDRARALLHAAIDHPLCADGLWLSTFLSRYRQLGDIAPRAQALSLTQLCQRLNRGARLTRHPAARFNYQCHQGRCWLSVAGHSIEVDEALAQWLCGSDDLNDTADQPLATLLQLVNLGALQLGPSRRQQ